MVIAQIIKNLRLSLGLEQDQFAKYFEVSTSTVSNWETGRRVPRIPKLKKMVDIAKEHKLKLTMQDFFPM
jgi:repressor LexA